MPRCVYLVQFFLPFACALFPSRLAQFLAGRRAAKRDIAAIAIQESVKVPNAFANTVVFVEVRKVEIGIALENIVHLVFLIPCRSLVVQDAAFQSHDGVRRPRNIRVKPPRADYAVLTRFKHHRFLEQNRLAVQANDDTVHGVCLRHYAVTPAA